MKRIGSGADHRGHRRRERPAIGTGHRDGERAFAQALSPSRRLDRAIRRMPIEIGGTASLQRRTHCGARAGRDPADRRGAGARRDLDPGTAAFSWPPARVTVTGSLPRMWAIAKTSKNRARARPSTAAGTENTNVREPRAGSRAPVSDRDRLRPLLLATPQQALSRRQCHPAWCRSHPARLSTVAGAPPVVVMGATAPPPRPPHFADRPS